MQKLGLTQTLSQKPSYQQILLTKLLEMPGEALPEKIEEALIENPALEKVEEAPQNERFDHLPFIEKRSFRDPQKRASMLAQTAARTTDFRADLFTQFQVLHRDPRTRTIGRYIIESLSPEGYCNCLLYTSPSPRDS